MAKRSPMTKLHSKEFASNDAAVDSSRCGGTQAKKPARCESGSVGRTNSRLNDESVDQISVGEENIKELPPVALVTTDKRQMGFVNKTIQPLLTPASSVIPCSHLMSPILAS